MRRLAPLGLIVGLWACGEESGTDGGVVPARDATLQDALPRDLGARDAEALPCDPAERIAGGGVAGGEISGRLSVFVSAAESGAPLAGAQVVVQIDGRELSLPSDADGCALFTGPGVIGAAAVSAFAAERSYLTLFNVNRSALSLTMGLLHPPHAATATISGRVRGFAVLTASTATVARFALADAITTDVLVSSPEQPNRPENANVPINLAIAGRNLAFDDYRLQVDAAGTTGVVLSAGNIYYPRSGRPEARFTHYGLRTGLHLAPGDWLRDQEVEITVPLTESFSLSVGERPSFSLSFAYAYLVLPGGGGWIFHDRKSVSFQDTLIFDDVPAMVGPLAGATYGAAVLVAEGERVSLVVSPGTAQPLLDVGALPLVPDEILGGDRELSAHIAAPRANELIGFVLERPSGTRWRMLFLETTDDPALRAPSVPGGFEDPLDGQGVHFTVQRLRYEGLDLRELRLQLLSDDRLRSLATNAVDLPL